MLRAKLLGHGSPLPLMTGWLRTCHLHVPLEPILDQESSAGKPVFRKTLGFSGRSMCALSSWLSGPTGGGGGACSGRARSRGAGSSPGCVSSTSKVSSSVSMQVSAVAPIVVLEDKAGLDLLRCRNLALSQASGPGCFASPTLHPLIGQPVQQQAVAR